MPFPRSLRAVLTAAGVALAVAATTLPAAPAQARTQVVPVPEGTSTVVITGQGFGHGHGMSQYGAKGAAEQGRTWQQIMAHYYPGTRLGKTSVRMRVLITADRSNDVRVAARSGLKVTGLGSPRRSWRLDQVRPRAVQWRITAPKTNRSAISWRARGGGWRHFRTVRGEAQFSAGSRPITLFTSAGRASYRGILRSAAVAKTGTRRDTVSILGLETYLRGVVPVEIPALWHPQAVRAQAVAARSYAAFERANNRRGHFDVFDTTQSQVYRGYGVEHPAANRAIAATAQRVVTYRGRPAFAQFSSSNGGWMLAGSQPYLVSGRDPYDPVSTWSVAIPLERFAARWPSAGRIVGLQVVTYPAAGGWIDKVVVDGERKDYTISGAEFRTWAGLKAANFTLATR